MKSFKVYSIDFRRFAFLLTPIMFRKKKMIDWLEVLLQPLSELNRLFIKFRNDSVYKVVHNGQVFSLEQVLNDSFDFYDRRIYILDRDYTDFLYIYPAEDDKPIYIYEESENRSVYVYDESAYESPGYEFIVHMPLDSKPSTEEALKNIETQIKALVNYYKLVSKRYTIIWI